MDAHSNPATPEMTADMTIAALRAEIVELKARIAQLSTQNAQLTKVINDERYERPPHY